MDLTPLSKIGARPENPTVAEETPSRNPKINPFIGGRDYSNNDGKQLQQSGELMQHQSVPER
jgi:hypothetical protein